MAAAADAPAVLSRRLPHEVAELARRLGVERGTRAAYVRLSQTGRMREGPVAAWIRFRADQTIALDHCAFEWRAATGPGGLIKVRDALIHSQGDLKVSAMGLVPLAHIARSPELTCGERMRYLGELAFAPDAIALNTQLRWQVLGTGLLSVAVGDGAEAARIELTLDAQGQIAEVYAAARPRAVAGGFAATPWRGRFGDYHHHHGRWLPFSAEAAWIVGGVEYAYWEGRIESWEMDAPI